MDRVITPHCLFYVDVITYPWPNLGDVYTMFFVKLFLDSVTVRMLFFRNDCRCVAMWVYPQRLTKQALSWRRPRMLRCHCLPPGSLHVLGAFGSLSKSHISFKHATLSGIKSKRPGENNLKATSANFSTTSARLAAGPLESYSGNVSNQDTTSEQHHSRIEITTKNMIDHMLSEQDFFFSFHTCHTWGLINIKMLSQQYKNL